MPRQARIKPDDIGTYYHLMNRAAGETGEYPFGDIEKEQFVMLLKEAAAFFTVEIIGYQIMGNHWHAVCFAPGETLDPEQTAERYNRFYSGRKPPLAADDPDCARIAADMRDISCFARWVQQRFTTWFNRTRPRRRRGSLWAGRFKSTILERATALWEGLCYIEMNAVRADIVDDPANYRFGSWGEWCGRGKHPFADNLVRHLVAYEGSAARATTIEQIRERFSVDLARRTAVDHGATSAEIDEAMSKAARAPAFALVLDRRMRYWSDGLVIGTKTFVREVAARRYGRQRAAEHRLQRAVRQGRRCELWAYRRLHTLPA